MNADEIRKYRERAINNQRDFDQVDNLAFNEAVTILLSEIAAQCADLKGELASLNEKLIDLMGAALTDDPIETSSTATTDGS
jgi:5'-3' exonuclease